MSLTAEMIAKRLRLDNFFTARIIRDLIDGEVDPWIFESVRRLCDKRFDGESAEDAATLSEEHEVNEILTAINEVLDGFGIEYIDEYGLNLAYCNLGETYKATVIYDFNEGMFLVTDWGSLVEKAMHNYNTKKPDVEEEEEEDEDAVDIEALEACDVDELTEGQLQFVADKLGIDTEGKSLKKIRREVKERFGG